MLIQLSDRVYLLPGGVNIGVIRAGESHVILVDSGLNETAARKAIRAARDELGSEIAAIVNTHGHADHFGGNAFIVKRSSARVWAPRLDDALIRYPLLLPSLLYGGADPVDSMRTPFMVADESPVDEIYDAGPIEVAGVHLEAISLAGHSPNQMGLLIDGVFFAADVVLPDTAIEKYRIPYLYSLTDHLKALEIAATVAATTVVPGHGPHTDSIAPLLERNQAVIQETQELVLAVCDRPRRAADVMKAVLDGSGATVADAPGYYLLQPTIAAYLTHLTRIGELVHEIRDNESLWVRK